MADAFAAMAVWLEQTTIASAVRTSTWGYPAVETAHLLGLSVLIGTAVAFDLRLLGLSSRLPVDAMAAHLLPWARLGFALAALSGVVLLSVQATTLLGEPLLYVKLGVITLAVANTSIFHRGVFRRIAEWNYSTQTPIAAKLAAVTSLVCWTTALACGRWLAYI